MARSKPRKTARPDPPVVLTATWRTCLNGHTWGARSLDDMAAVARAAEYPFLAHGHTVYWLAPTGPVDLKVPVEALDAGVRVTPRDTGPPVVAPL